ncbi:oxygen-independent coproporphyrinogen III oxidase [Arenibaculum pallidiluteum]|uniref:oxygen-independent coproporphyrinogen III oxidase n=1 Tax=Arenibaculum pallidiluteum TaxID=2812559 RepID=UPI001A965140|nr:oxygen-independent coproporphyrinogen III oxidase [Arenibaculum pallidiluteum]
MDNIDLIARYDGHRVPRYTSYPTAPHFSPGIGPDTYLGWVRELDPDEPVSLYLHVPFCHAMCWYCGCNTRVVARYQPIADYLGALDREIAMVAAVLPARMKVAHIHFGGGTPTMMAPRDFTSLMDRLRSRLDLLPQAEVAVEIDPRTLDPEMPAALARGGVNRVSLGVQDLNPRVQEAINRIQPFAATQGAVEALRGVGIEGINLDLMYGLPHQTPETCAESARQVLGLAPDRLSIFGYAHVPWMKTHQRLIDEKALADSRGRWLQFDMIARTLSEGGYEQIGLDHFALPQDPLALAQRAGRLHRNFQGYTTDEAGTLLGFGASAIGSLPQGYVQNDPAHERYGRAVAAGRPAVTKGLRLSPDDRLRREVIERLMCNLTVDLAEVAAAHGTSADVFAEDVARLAPLVEDGIAGIEGSRVFVEDAMRPLVRLAAAVFDAYLDRGAARHSLAV